MDIIIYRIHGARIARPTRKRNVIGSNPTEGKKFSFCNSRACSSESI